LIPRKAPHHDAIPSIPQSSESRQLKSNEEFFHTIRQ